MNTVLAQPLRHEDIEGVYAGLRPLLQGDDAATSKLSREHAVSQSVSGLITVAGGKYTTYRVMAKDVVDIAARDLDRKVPPCCTDQIPLVGATGYRAYWNRRELLAERSGLNVHMIEHLLLALRLAHPGAARSDHRRSRAGRAVDGAPTYLAAEIHYAASHEGALHLDDVLTRRTRISIETFDRGCIAARDAAKIMAGILDWDARSSSPRDRALRRAGRGGAREPDAAR